ncbi:riboflavin kinase-like [Antedon mediterranea]|uniref:riboflavin kinase-like n=1 Tax=Antedon mediterranea TaxID=105859 RepID=UPI003AF8F722
MQILRRRTNPFRRQLLGYLHIRPNLYRPSSSRGTDMEEVNDFSKHIPYFARGEVVKGFGRGSKQLGIPTANFPIEVVNDLPNDFATGVYYGWARVNDGQVHKMVMSIGWNPFYDNVKKSMETHIIHDFKEDFYGSTLSIIILGYIREEKNFSSLDELIMAIKADIAEAENQLNKPDKLVHKENNFFKDPK